MAETTNFDRGLDRLERAIGHAPYWFWPPSLAIVPDGPGAYAVNRPLPDQETLHRQMVQEGIFCQGVINVIRRANRKVVPTRGDSRYDGGTWANQGFFEDFIRPFRRTDFIPRGALIGRYFKWGNGGAVLDQGHVGVLVVKNDLAHQQSGVLLHSHPAVGGLARTDLGVSHAGWYYDYWIHPEDWINHSKGGF